ncbi:hypothetical protein EBR21_14650, partial [bacterium]|nr:hypothetical protein [bacterium]
MLEIEASPETSTVYPEVHVPLRTKFVTFELTLAAPEIVGAVAARVSFTVNWNVRLAVAAAVSAIWKVRFTAPNTSATGVTVPTQFGQVPLHATAPEVATMEGVLDEYVKYVLEQVSAPSMSSTTNPMARLVFEFTDWALMTFIVGASLVGLTVTVKLRVVVAELLSVRDNVIVSVPGSLTLFLFAAGVAVIVQLSQVSREALMAEETRMKAAKAAVA